MATTTYTYTISTDFPNGKVAPDRLAQEIRESSIVTALKGIDTDADVCNVEFKDPLSAGDRITLDGNQSPPPAGSLIGDHSGDPLTDVQEVSIDNTRYDRDDNKWIVAISPAPPNTMTWYTSAGDQKDPLVRGGGTRINVKIPATDTPPNTYTATMQFAEPVYLHDGELNWKPIDEFSIDDEFKVHLNFPATSVTVNPGGTGNCNLVEIADPAYVIIPAAGDGTHDVDLTEAVPLPDAESGTWTVDKKTGVITPGAPSSSNAYVTAATLLTVPNNSIYLVNPMVMSSPRGVFEIDAYLVEWIHQNWTISLTVDKAYQNTSDCAVGGFMMVFRYNAT